ncbi:MAG: hypothetical protein IPJ19_19705 [Planctomycetes bacterium]|nr:hypothetical protein [Planctomycetota bacterium]
MDRLGLPLALSALALLCHALAPARVAAQDPAPQKPAPPPTPQLLEGLEMESALVYDADPLTPHVLRASFAGKEHARWWIGAGPSGGEQRILRLRSEARVFALEVGSAKSVELEAAERDLALAQLELRRALIDYEGFEWKPVDGGSSAALGTLGRLHARFEKAGDARPSEIRFLDPKGVLQDSCRGIRWEADSARPKPLALEFWHDDARVWKEQVKRVQAMTYTRDAFLPRDRLEGPTPSSGWRVLASPSPEYAARRFELPRDADWGSARKELDRLRAEWGPRLEPAGLELENRGTLELDEELRPRFVVLRLSSVPKVLPEGFERVSGRSAVGTPLEGFEKVEAGALRALREQVPARAKRGAPYVRWLLGKGEVKQVLLLVAWESAK